MIDVLILASALAQTAQPTASQAVPHVWATVTSNGEVRASAGFSNPNWQTETTTYYLVANPTACITLATPRKPEGPFEGWAVEIGPGRTGPHVKWTRFAKTGDRSTSTRTLLAASRSTIVLDEWPEPPAGDRCKAAVWGLEARMGTRLDNEHRVMEAELWFVHKTPSGTETTQRQVIRMKDGDRGDFYFDDMTVNANVAGRTEPVTVEVFGTVHTGRMDENGAINMTLYLTRRYVNPKAVPLGVPPTVGKTEYPTTVKAGEVLSFVLPPLEQDRGQFLGHRFSLRLRIKPLSPGQN